MGLFKVVAAALLVLILTLLVAAGGLWLYLGPDDPHPAVAAPGSLRSLAQGELIGSHDGGDTYVWRGIPYATPPVDDLRWKAPLPPASWADRREALTFAPQCLQVSAGSPEPSGSEDCLYLNIWSPAFSELPTGNARLPVMVWIHGGGNSIGSASTSVYSGAHLVAAQNVIVVSIHYRLGPLGWFRHPALWRTGRTPEDNSGNYGTLDIVESLHWTRRNIEAFGGDPGNITIFGESAGGFNVLSMMVSPLARGLFHKAISQSGGLSMTDINHAENYSDDPSKGHQYSGREIVNQLLVRAGVANDRAQARVKQEAMPAAELYKLLYATTPEELFAPYGGGFAGMLGNPDLFRDGHVLPRESILQLFTQPGAFNEVPVILGTNRDETKLFNFMGPATRKLLGVIPTGPVDAVAYERDNRYASRMWKARAVDELANRLATSQQAPVFAYRFDVDDWRDLGPVNFSTLLGAAHAMEIPFVFGTFLPPMRILFPGSKQDEFTRVSEAMGGYWAQFARTGNPATGTTAGEIRWEAWIPGQTTRKLMVFDTISGGDIRMSDDLVTFESIRAGFLADKSYKSQAAYCEGYRRLFRDQLFDAAEYKNLGDGGCKPIL